LLPQIIANKDSKILELEAGLATISPMDVKSELVGTGSSARARDEFDDEAVVPPKRVCMSGGSVAASPSEDHVDADGIIARLAKSLNAALVEKPLPTEADWGAKFGSEARDVDEREKMLQQAKDVGFVAMTSMG
jgi:hypothetical protein